MKPLININPTPHFLFFAEMQMSMHEYAMELKPGVKPEWFGDITMGLQATGRAMVGLVFGVKVSDSVAREVTICWAPPNKEFAQPEVYIEFLQVNANGKTFASLFEKSADRDIKETRSVTIPNDTSNGEVGLALTEDIYQFLFTGEIPEILTY